MSQQRFPNADALFMASMAAFRRGDFDAAETGFQRATFELSPGDPRLPEAKFYLAECQFANGAFLEASRSFRRVSDETPEHAMAPVGLLRSADALAELWKRPELDPTYGENAAATYRELLGRYPASEAAQRARVRVAALNERFAEKEYKNGVFYLRLGAYDAAIILFRLVVAEYPDSRRAPDALIKMIEAYRRIGYDDEMREKCAHLRQYYPGARGVEEACGPATAG
jgi:outer membrane assembly lipoprotein YfiO